MSTTTAQNYVDNWCSQLRAFFDDIATIARPRGWNAAYTSTAITEDPFGIGARTNYDAPVLNLKRSGPGNGEGQQITFEPRHRITLGSAGRIDVYSYPQLREAMLLRVPDTNGADNLTWDDAEKLVAIAPWKAFSQERLPLSVNLSDKDSVRTFLEDLVA